MGKALYRSYRPKKLEDVVGQEHITTTLKNALDKNQISHAYLFTGPKGVGKTSVARILAHEVNSLEYKDDSIHLDIIEIDAASNRRIDEIRELRDKINIAPTSAKYKVYIIDEVHMLTREAFNALLKTLEEPPEHAIFILATTELHKVPETIISRTQRFNFKPITSEKAQKLLREISKKEKINVNNEALNLITQHGDGSFRDSISILDQLSGLPIDSIGVDDVKELLGIPNNELIDKVLQSLENDDAKSLFESIRLFKEQGIDSSKASQTLSRLLREKLVDNNTNFSAEKIIKILKDLLPLTANNNDYVGLELALLSNMNLDAISKNRSPKIENKDLTKSVVPEPSMKNENTSKTNSTFLSETSTEIASSKSTKELEAHENIPDPIKPQLEKENSNFSLDSWKQLLEKIKGEHNTLYGVLRMAEPSIKDNKLYLEFKFSFHKKQVDNQQNLSIISKLSQDLFATKDIVTIAKKNTKNNDSSTNSPQVIQNDEAIKGITNIFKGAELLD